MRTILLAALVAGVTATAASAQDAPAAEPTHYIAVSGGVVGGGDYSYGPAKTDYDSGTQVSVAYGMDLPRPNFRAEMALSYRKQGGETSLFVNPFVFTLDAEISAIVVDVNAYYDFPVHSRVQPYVGAGFGLAGVTLDDGLVDDTGTTANIQLMAGATVPLDRRAELFVEGRWQRVGMFTIDATAIGGSDDEKIALSGFGAVAGLRFRF